MELRRSADMTRRGKFWFRLKRVITEVVLIALCGTLVLFLPKEAQYGIVSLFITKTVFVVIGILVAHSSRKFAFPYMDLQKMLDDHHWAGVVFLAVWYFVIIWAFAVGG